MKRTITIGALLLAACSGLQGRSVGHGGTYRGPGDTVPAEGGVLEIDTTASGPKIAAGRTGRQVGPVCGGPGPSAVDLTLWEFWWGFNKERFLYSEDVRGARAMLRPSDAEVRHQIVPALLEALATERHEDIVPACLIGLAKIGDARGASGDASFQPVIVEFLADANQDVSETAALALGILGHETSVPILRDLLFDNVAGRQRIGRRVPTRTRAFAGFGLGLIGHRTANQGVRREIVAILVEMLAGDARSMLLRDVPVACITSLGLVALDVEPTRVVQRCRVVPECRHCQLAWLLEYYGDEDVNPLTRAHVPTALARLAADLPEPSGLKTAVAEVLLADIAEDSEAQRVLQQSSVLALGLLGDADEDEIDRQIRAALSRAPEFIVDIQARHFSLIALAEVGSRPGADAASAPEVRRYLLRQFTHGKSSMRRWAGLALGVFERALADHTHQPVHADTASKLRSVLADSKSALDMGAYAIGTGILGDPQATDVLLEKLERIREPSTRGILSISLGLLDASASIGPILEIVESSKYQPDLLKSAAIGLGLLARTRRADWRPCEVSTALMDMLVDARGLTSKASVATALGYLGDPRTVDALLELLRDRREEGLTRGFAAVALGIVADRDALPWNAKIAANLNYRANTETLTHPARGNGILDIQ